MHLTPQGALGLRLPLGQDQAGALLGASIFGRRAAEPMLDQAGAAIYRDVFNDRGPLQPRKLTATASQFVTGLGLDGVFTAAQPAFTDLSGNLGAGQMPTSAATSYAGVTLAGLGLAAVAAAVQSTGQAASIGSTNLLTSAVAGLYIIFGTVTCTSAGSAGTVSVSVTHTDADSSATIAAVSGNISLTSTTNAAGNSALILRRVKAGTNVTYSTTVTGATGSPQYSVSVVAVRLA